MNKSRTSSDTIEDFSSTLTYIELVTIGTIMIVVCIITIIGNALVMISFIMDKQLRTLSNYFLLSLAISDVMIATFSMPLFIAYLFIGEWTLGPTLCDIWLAQDYTCSNASCMNLLMIGFDRYFSVTNPLKYRAKKTPKRVGIMISIVWIVAFLLWPPWIYAWPYIEGRRTVPEDDCYIQFLATNSYITFIIAIIDYYAPVTIMLVLYYKIWQATKRRNRYLADMDSEYHAESMCLQKNSSFGTTDSRERTIETPVSNNTVSNNNKDNLTADDASGTTISLLQITAKEENQMQVNGCDIEMNEHTQKISDSNLISEANSKSSNCDTSSSKMSFFKKERAKPDKAARVLTAILLAFLLTTTPYNILIIINNLDKTHTLIPDYLVNFASFLFYFNSTLNPLCYALANENFRKTYWQILTCSWSKKSKYAIHNYSNKSSQSKQSFDAKYATSFL